MVCPLEEAVLRKISAPVSYQRITGGFSSHRSNSFSTFQLYRFYRYKSTQIGILFVIVTDSICVEYGEKGGVPMDDTFVRNRISELRTKKGVSEYKMSLDLGHSKSYIQSISSGKALPSFSEFLYICEYLGVTPKEFFDSDSSEPQMICRLTKIAKTLSPEDLSALINMAERLADK